MKQPIILIINAIAGFAVAMLISSIMFAGLLGGALVLTLVISCALIAGYIFAVKSLLKKFSTTGPIKEPMFSYINYAMPFIMVAIVALGLKMGW